MCAPHEYIAKTGAGIQELAVSKKTVRWPFQRVQYVSIKPTTLEFRLHNMSAEKIEFELPTVFTVAPIDPAKDIEGFKRYARKMNEASDDFMRTTLQGIIEGETRGLTAGLTVEEMFSAKDRFKDEVVTKVADDLSKVGIEVLNANFKELSDYSYDNRYFEYRKKRAIETANYESQAQVAAARRDGEIGVEDARRATRIEVARMEQEAKLAENERNQKVAMSNAELARVRAEADRIAQIAAVEANMAA